MASLSAIMEVASSTFLLKELDKQAGIYLAKGNEPLTALEAG